MPQGTFWLREKKKNISFLFFEDFRTDRWDVNKHIWNKRCRKKEQRHKGRKSLQFSGGEPVVRNKEGGNDFNTLKNVVKQCSCLKKRPQSSNMLQMS